MIREEKMVKPFMTIFLMKCTASILGGDVGISSFSADFGETGD